MNHFITGNNLVFLEFFFFIFGTVIGSFLNVCIARIPAGESLIYPPSHCPGCKSKIKPQHNIPLLSYFILKGKCADCSSRISIQYPIVELSSGLLTFFLFTRYGISLEFFGYLILTMSLIVITLIDLKYMIIPNIISIPGIALGLLFNLLRTDWQTLTQLIASINLYNFFRIIGEIPLVNSVTGIIFGGGIFLLVAYLYKIIRKMDGLGMGDVKLLAMLGAFLGSGAVFFIIFVSSLLGTLVGVSYIVYKKGDMKYAIPYGPFLSLSAVIYIFTGGLKFIFSLVSGNSF